MILRDYSNQFIRTLTSDEELSIRREGDRIRRFEATLVRETSIEQECRIREMTYPHHWHQFKPQLPSV